MYFTQRGPEIVILLAGADKSSQAKDIQAAQVLARQIKALPGEGNTSLATIPNNAAKHFMFLR